MTILVTRPANVAERTRVRLAEMGHDVMTAPLLVLKFRPPERLIGSATPDAVVITSANGAHAVADHPDLAKLSALPLWTVGSRTTRAAKEIGFTAFRNEAQDLHELGGMLGREKPQTLLYLAGEARSGDLAALAPRHTVETRVVYSALPVQTFPSEAADALRAGRISHVLHYSRRLAETYLALAAAEGLKDAALAPRQLCLSDRVAAPLQAAGAKQILTAVLPREEALLALVEA